MLFVDELVAADSLILPAISIRPLHSRATRYGVTTLSEHEKTVDSIELQRGVLTLAVMSQLHEPHYGYSLRQALHGRGLTIEEGTLYPLLRRCEQRGLLASEWRVFDGRPRRYYILTDSGRDEFQRLVADWVRIVSRVNGLVGV